MSEVIIGKSDSIGSKKLSARSTGASECNEPARQIVSRVRAVVGDVDVDPDIRCIDFFSARPPEAPTASPGPAVRPELLFDGPRPR